MNKQRFTVQGKKRKIVFVLCDGVFKINRVFLTKDETRELRTFITMVVDTMPGA